MHEADLKHPTLQKKLEQLYRLRGGADSIALGFREPYLKLLEAFGNPHENLPPIIHVAGTNGKGSTIAMMRAMLEAGGYKVHVYTSPHLHKFNERIVLAGQQISDAMLEQLVDQAVHLNQNRAITFFEITTAIAFKAFTMIPADIVLLEVGLGGRLDCTNIVSKPYVSVINLISKDHSEFLGNSYTKIANEKSGIVKEAATCITAKQYGEALKENIEDVFIDVTRNKNAPLYMYGRDWCIDYNNTGFTVTIDGSQMTLPIPNLIGRHQIYNAGLAASVMHLARHKFPLTTDQMATGLRNTKWPGRLERVTLKEFPALEIWFDGGHNDSAGEALAHQCGIWSKQDNKPLHIICGMKGDKDFKRFLEPLLNHAVALSIVPVPYVDKCLNMDQVQKNITDLPDETHTHENIHAALKHVQPGARVLICGSFYLRPQL